MGGILWLADKGSWGFIGAFLLLLGGLAVIKFITIVL